jgi:hypothetical protein
LLDRELADHPVTLRAPEVTLWVMAEQTLPPPHRPGPPYYASVPEPEQPRSRPSGLFVAAIVGGALLLVVVTVVVTVMLVNPSTTSGPTGTRPVGKAAQAAELCQQAVLDRLKSPATASFSNVTTELVSEVYYVKGSVDSENGFGATMRSDWSCDIFAGGSGLATPNVYRLQQRN